MPSPTSVTVARSQVAHAVRLNRPATEVAHARRALTGAKLRRAVVAALADDNPPTATARVGLAALLPGKTRQ